MARQTALRRLDEAIRKRQDNGLPVSPNHNDPKPPSGSGDPVLGGPPLPSSHLSPASDPDNSSSSMLEPASPPPADRSPATHTQPTGHVSPYGKEIWDNILLLLDLCRLPVNTSPLLYIILNEVSTDPKEVYNRWERALEELKLSSPLWLKEDALRRVPPVEHPLAPWATSSMYYPPSAPSLPQHPAVYRHTPYHLHTLRHQPYQLLPSRSRLDSIPYALFQDQLMGGAYSVRSRDSYTHVARPSVLVGPSECYRFDDQKPAPASPTSVHSDKSSLSGSLDV